MTTLPALSLHQPYATLCATPAPCGHTCGCAMHPCPHCDRESNPRMVKRWETRSRPCPPKYLGQRIAIASTVRHPTGGQIGDCLVASRLGQVRSVLRSEASRTLELHYLPDLSRRWRLPLGAVVCTAVIARSLPIRVDFTPYGEAAIVVPSAAMHWTGPRLVPADGSLTVDISDQLPYGDWTPGRWAWELVDVEPVDMPSGSHKGRQGWHTAEVC